MSIVLGSAASVEVALSTSVVLMSTSFGRWARLRRLRQALAAAAQAACPTRGRARGRRCPRPRAIRGAEVPVAADLAKYGAQVVAKVVDRWAPPEPIAVVD